MQLTTFESRGYLGLRPLPPSDSGVISFRWELVLVDCESSRTINHVDPAYQPGSLAALNIGPATELVLQRDGIDYALSLPQLFELWYLHQHYVNFMAQPGGPAAYYRLKASAAHRGNQGALKEEGIQYACFLLATRLTLSADARDFFAHDAASVHHSVTRGLHQEYVLPWIGALRLKRLHSTNC